MTEENKKLLKSTIVQNSTPNPYKDKELEGRLHRHSMSAEELKRASKALATKGHKKGNCKPNADGIVFCS